MFNQVIKFDEQKSKQRPKAGRRKATFQIAISAMQRPSTGRRSIILYIPLSELKKAGLGVGDKVVMWGIPDDRVIGIRASDSNKARTLSASNGQEKACVEFPFEEKEGLPCVPRRLACSGALHGDKCLYFIGPKETQFGKWVKDQPNAR
ncbi:hypothetical protein [Halomonas sp. PBN3]|uniref:hypothetical protein n=1 Tax=Halomonas sp. PBN3 TaxID=1397528 RepID=UPI0003B88230|nr:hypothetical protein [Halomonas sp. PBN3]ERS88831.1 hypothetical protein Q671_07910 [Halomonas sp. PBN3]